MQSRQSRVVLRARRVASLSLVLIAAVARVRLPAQEAQDAEGHPAEVHTSQVETLKPAPPEPPMGWSGSAGPPIVSDEIAEKIYDETRPNVVKGTEFITLEYAVDFKITSLGPTGRMESLSCSHACRGDGGTEHPRCTITLCDRPETVAFHSRSVRGSYEPDLAAMRQAEREADALSRQLGGKTVEWSHTTSTLLRQFEDWAKRTETLSMPHSPLACAETTNTYEYIRYSFEVTGRFSERGRHVERGQVTPINRPNVKNHRETVAFAIRMVPSPSQVKTEVNCACHRQVKRDEPGTAPPPSPETPTKPPKPDGKTITHPGLNPDGTPRKPPDGGQTSTQPPPPPKSAQVAKGPANRAGTADVVKANVEVGRTSTGGFRIGLHGFEKGPGGVFLVDGLGASFLHGLVSGHDGVFISSPLASINPVIYPIQFPVLEGARTPGATEAISGITPAALQGGLLLMTPTARALFGIDPNPYVVRGSANQIDVLCWESPSVIGTAQGDPAAVSPHWEFRGTLDMGISTGLQFRFDDGRGRVPGPELPRRGLYPCGSKRDPQSPGALVDISLGQAAVELFRDQRVMSGTNLPAISFAGPPGSTFTFLITPHGALVSLTGLDGKLRRWTLSHGVWTEAGRVIEEAGKVSIVPAAFPADPPLDKPLAIVDGARYGPEVGVAIVRNWFGNGLVHFAPSKPELPIGPAPQIIDLQNISPGPSGDRDPDVQNMAIDMSWGPRIRVGPSAESRGPGPGQGNRLSLAAHPFGVFGFSRLSWTHSGAPRLLSAGRQPAWPVPTNAEDKGAALGSALRILLVSLGTSSGEAFQAHILNDSAQPVRLSGGAVIVEPLKKAAQAQAMAWLRGRAATAPALKLDAYCVEYLKAPPSAGTIFRVATRDVQARFSPLRRVLEAAQRLEREGRIHPDSDPREYIHSLRQWALWSKERGFDGKGFAKAFVERAKANLTASGQPWTRALEGTVGNVATHRWQDIAEVLREADAPAPAVRE